MVRKEGKKATINRLPVFHATTVAQRFSYRSLRGSTMHCSFLVSIQFFPFVFRFDMPDLPVSWDCWDLLDTFFLIQRRFLFCLDSWIVRCVSSLLGFFFSVLLDLRFSSITTRSTMHFPFLVWYLFDSFHFV